MRFPPGKSTVAALLSTTQDWFQLLEKGKEVGAVFFDFHKAFDTVSRKKQDTHPNPSISLNGCPLEFTPTFKYLGLLISSDLSWSSHIDNICSKAKRILELLYRHFYRHSNEQTLRQLYLSLVRPHVEYAAPVWSPHLNKYITMLERTQQFACKMCKKFGILVTTNYWTGFTYQHLHSVGCT